MPTRRIPRRVEFDLEGTLHDYLLNRSVAERASSIESRLKADLMTHLETSGEEIDGGHRVIPIEPPAPLMTYKNGVPREVGVKGIKRTQRKSTSLDQDKAMALLKELDLVAECTEVEIVLDEDKLLAANYKGKITDEQLATLYEDRITYAFDLIRE